MWAYLAPPPPNVSGLSLSTVPTMRLVVASGQAAPTGGNFDRFDIASQPIVAPVNVRGHVAFYASVIRSKTSEGIFLATDQHFVKVAAVGDAVPGGGKLSEFAKHPIPALNDSRSERRWPGPTPLRECSWRVGAHFRLSLSVAPMRRVSRPGIPGIRFPGDQQPGRDSVRGDGTARTRDFAGALSLQQRQAAKARGRG